MPVRLGHAPPFIAMLPHYCHPISLPHFPSCCWRQLLSTQPCGGEYCLLFPYRKAGWPASSPQICWLRFGDLGGGGCVGPYPGSSALPPGSCHFCHQLWKVVPWARSCQRLLRGQGEAVDQPAAFPCWEDHSPLSPKGIPGPSSGMVRWRKQVSGRSELHAKMMNSRAESSRNPSHRTGWGWSPSCRLLRRRHVK